MEKTEKHALVLDPIDNVCILLSDAGKNDTVILSDKKGTIPLTEAVKFGHKTALKPIKSGNEIIKYGQRIGIATKNIRPGEWVHLHNMKSVVDPDFSKRIER